MPQDLESSARLLETYTALDLTDLKGQLCGRFLTDLGMEVIKVEPPGGDLVRRLGPHKEVSNGAVLSLRFAHLNANKKSIILDLQAEKDRGAFHRLVQRADVVLESFPPGSLDSIGLGYRDLEKVNPRLVMASISGFGQTGPRREFAYTDIVAFAMSGLMYLSGDPTLPPSKPPETQAYYFGSLMAALGVVAALYNRDRTGLGNWVDVSMQEALATQEHSIRLYANDRKIVQRNGSQHANVAPAKIFPCRDGYVYLYVSRRHWKTLLQVWNNHPAELDNPEWVVDPFRRPRADYVNQSLTDFTIRYSKEELTTLLQSHGIPCVPVNRPRDFITDDHVQARHFFLPVNYPDLGEICQPSAPFLINGRRPSLRTAPVLGEHQDEVWDRLKGESKSRTTDPSDPGQARNQRPLSGIRILSFDQVLAGPYGMTLLAELGADVIKVESRRGGLDLFRFFGTSQDPNLSPRFLEFNRNKRSVTVNLKSPEGPQVIKDLARRCDVVIDNFSVHVMPSLGLDYTDLVQAKSDIVTLRMPGLGCTGPKKAYATLGTNITAFTGFTYLWNHPGKSDMPVGSQIVLPDYVSGLMAATLIVSSVLYRNRTGQGAFIDFSQAEAASYMIGVSLMESLLSDRELEPIGNDWPYAAPHGCYACKGEDRWCVIAIETDEQWRALASEIGLPDLAKDERFNSLPARRQRQSELDALLGAWTRERDCHEVMNKLQRIGVPCGVVQNGADLVADEHIRSRGFLVEQENPRLGRLTLPGVPIRFANTVDEPIWEFPVLGRDNDAVLGNLLGYTPERIAQLAREGVLD